MQGQRRAGARPAEPRTGAGVANRPENSVAWTDVNRDRLVFCLTSFVGHKVTAMLRNNVTYEGLFHSCALDGDLSITLKYARKLASDSNAKSGDIVTTLVIPGKDFLQVSSSELPPPSSLEGVHSRTQRQGFRTDAEISRNKDGTDERELVAWSGGTGEAMSIEETDGRDWNQFDANAEKFQIQSSWNEDLYTTKLDPARISQEKREQADRIAREIEQGTCHADIEDQVDGQDNDGDEEAMFSSVAPIRPELREVAKRPLPQMPQPHYDGSNQLSKARANLQEMKRINALNLEPTLPKEDSARHPRHGGLKEAGRGQRLSGAIVDIKSDIKSDFEQSLELIKKQSSKQGSTAAAAAAAAAGGCSSGQMASWQGQSMMQRKADGGQHQQQQQGGYPGNMDNRVARSRGGLNPNAPAFNFNPQAGEFTPSNSAQNASQPSPTMAKPIAPSPPFHMFKKDNGPRKTVAEMLEPFFQRARMQNPESSAPDWPDAKGPQSYKEVLGVPNQLQRPPMMMAPVAQGNQHPVPMPVPAGPWPQPMGQGSPNDGPQMGPMGGQMGQMQAQPQMMQPGFVVAGPPGGPPMYQQMYAPPGPQGNPGGQNGMQQGQQGGMPQQAVVFNQQGMAGMMANAGQQMAVPMMMGPQGQMAVPKFAVPGGQQMMVMQHVMMAPGQYQQNFMPQQDGGMQQGHQGQMMQQQMYQRG